MLKILNSHFSFLIYSKKITIFTRLNRLLTTLFDLPDMRNIMKSLSETMMRLPLPIKSVVITVMTLLFSHIVVYDLMSVSFFSPMEKASDFKFSDFYTIVADDRAVSELDNDIVIVPVDGYTRREMAEVIDAIDFSEPAAVGIDIAFAAPSNPDDDPLVEALASCTNLVMPVRIDHDKKGKAHLSHISYYDDIVQPSGGFAAVNIQGDAGERSTVREFVGSFTTEEGDVPSFAKALVGIVRPEAVKKLELRGAGDEYIKFASREFDTVDPEEILGNQDLVKGKIVLVGKMLNAGDLHVTPLDNFMPGLLIHAHTAATIISGDYIRTLTPFETCATAAIACFIIVWFNMWLIVNPVGPLVVRLVQIGLLYLMIVGGTMAYIKHGIDLNFSFAIMAATLGVAACDVYIGLFNKNGLCDRIARLFCKTNTKLKQPNLKRT